MKIGLHRDTEGHIPIRGRPEVPEEPHKKRPQKDGAMVHRRLVVGFFREEVI